MARERFLQPARSVLAVLLWPALSTPARPPLPAIDPELPVERRAAGRPLAPPPGARAMTVELHEDLRFRYLEVGLGVARSDAPRPLVVLLHGRGDGPRIPTGDYTEGVPVRLVLPYAPEMSGVGWSWIETSVLDGRDAALAEELRERAAELALFLEELSARHPTRGRPIVTGFSQGGMLALALALRHPDALRAAVPLGAWVPPSLVPSAPATPSPPIRALHGEADPVMRFPAVESLYATLGGRGFDARLESYPDIPHRMSEAMKARHLALLAGALPPLVAGPDSAEREDRAMAVPR